MPDAPQTVQSSGTGHDVPNVAALTWDESSVVASSGTARVGNGSGKGDSEAIAIAHERDALLILGDALARRHASLIGVRLTGTLDALLKAKAEGQIPMVAPLVSSLMELGFWLSDKTREAVLKLAREI